MDTAAWHRHTGCFYGCAMGDYNALNALLAEAILNATVPDKSEHGALLGTLDLSQVHPFARSPFWRQLAQKTGDDLIGLRAGDTIEKRVLGPLFYLMSTAGTLREGLHLATRFIPILDPLMRVDFDDGGVLTWDLNRPLRTDDTSFTLRQETDFVGAFAYRLVKDLLPTLCLEEVTTMCADGSGEKFQKRFEAHFECPCRLTGREAGFSVRFRAEDLDAAMPSADQVLQTIILKSAHEELADAPGNILDVYDRALAAGDDSSTAIADRLGISERSLHRRLGAAGTSHRDLQSTSRFRTARTLLSGDQRIREVGKRVGFADVTSFARAFRRWTGMAPSMFRDVMTGR